MSKPRPRDIPVRATGVVLALALIAGVVAGREQPDTPSLPEPQRQPVRDALKEDFDFDPVKLVRERQDGEFQNLFASPHVPSPVAAAAPVVVVKAQPAPAPSAPMAPPLPFKYLGRMVDGDRITVFLQRNQETLSAVQGETLDNAYRIEAVADAAIHFRFLPLGIDQVLHVPASK